MSCDVIVLRPGLFLFFEDSSLRSIPGYISKLLLFCIDCNHNKKERNRRQSVFIIWVCFSDIFSSQDGLDLKGEDAARG
jgi:hypothetical protein